MKALAKITAGIALAAVLFFAWFGISTRLGVTAAVTVTPATQDEEAFDAFRERMTSPAFSGYVYETGILASPSDYSFVTITVTAKNRSLFPAEWVILTPIPKDNDIACDISMAGPADIRGGKTAELSVTYLTASPEAVTECGIEYYVFGKLQTATVRPETADRPGQ